jgi:hypothetical protein
MTSPHEPKKYIEVLFEPGRDKPQLAEKFTYTYPGDQPNTVDVRPEPSKMAEPNVRPGHPARGVHPTSPMAKCTAGWNIFFNTHVACVSCAHVLCANGNNSVIGQPVELNNAIQAKLHCFQQVALNDPSRLNVWDLAIAEYNIPANAEGRCLPCASGNTHPYPMDLTPNNAAGQPMTGQTFHKVGLAPPVCGSGTLVGTGAIVSIPFWGGTAYFKNALKFTHFAIAGDSGAVIVRDSDNTVSGLHFCSNPTYSYSNPLFQIPWTRAANYTVNPDPLPGYNCSPPVGRCC